MILTCPNCDTRYSVDGAKFPAAGRTVRCAKCGHSWHQAAEQPAPEPEPVAMVPEAVPVAQVAAPFAPTSPTRAYAPAAAAQAPVERRPVGPKLALLAGWLGLILVVLVIAFCAVRYRQDIAVIWPQSAGVYSSLGLKVNASGIDFHKIDYRRETEDGQTVLAVTGEIVNLGKRELPVPQAVRVTLSDANKHELYHWTFKPSATTLKPGDTIPFTTRLASPPAAARNLELTFAKDGP